jgi:mannosyltransferase
MMLGVFLRYVLRRKYKLIFTSSSPRERGGLTKWLVAKMDHLIATNALNAAVMPGAPSIVPHGVDPAVFTPRAAEKAPRARKSIGCIGRIRPKQGTAEFVRAMCLLLPEFEGWDAHIFGRVDDDAYEKALRAMCEKAGVADRVIFHAPRPIEEMPDIYRSLDIVVAPSHLEGFGLTPIEAGACGVPCIASRGVGCFDEAIIAGKTGDLAAVGDADSFARAIRPFMADDKLRQSAGKMARDHIVSNFSIAIEAAALNDVYKRLLANG